ncbi:MAG: hypothetical protein IJU29_09750, partial [Oscillospiraceae bacterium]|nr:hypothetical protein [Oscillospiraceae bacterium]
RPSSVTASREIGRATFPRRGKDRAQDFPLGAVHSTAQVELFPDICVFFSEDVCHKTEYFDFISVSKIWSRHYVRRSY